MARYALHHRHPFNLLTHVVGVPAIVWSILVWLADVPVPGVGDAAVVLITAIGAMYLSIELTSAIATLAWVIPLYLHAAGVAGDPDRAAQVMVLFVLGWAFQFLGHAVEGKRPALFENLFQVFVAPVFVTVEVLQRAGFYRDVAEATADLLTDLE
jgi:uncharacterized membrane protein YGL010W